MKFPSRSVAGNTSVRVIVAQVSGKPVMGKYRVRNALKDKDSALTNGFSTTSFPCHLPRSLY